MSLSMDLAQRLRIRELSKYFSVISASPGNEEFLHGANANLDDKCFSRDGLKLIPARAAIDTHLTALAQLAAFKLQCRRSFISIVDDTHQHIIAEGTRSISLLDKDDHELDDGLLFGVQSLSFTRGTFPTTIRFSHNKTILQGEGNCATSNHIIINDLTAEPATQGFSVVAAFPLSLRYFVEVPLRTPSGLLLGSICVVDSESRQPGPKDVARLQEVAQLVVQHLDGIRLKEDHGRAERLLEGLAHFVQGKESLSTWSEATPGQNFIAHVLPQSSNLSSIRLRDHRRRAKGVRARSRTSDTSSTLSAAPVDANSVQSSATSPDTTTPPTSDCTDQATVPQKIGNTEVETSSDLFLADGVTRHPGTQIGSMTSGVIGHVFSRASNLIRESMTLEGTCFLEVPHNERATLTNKANSARCQKKANKTDSDSDKAIDSSGDAASEEIGLESPSEDALCHRLGFSTQARSSLAHSVTTQAFLTIPASLLKRLVAKYPEGYIFHFDQLGSVSSGDDSNQARELSGNVNVETMKPKKKKVSGDLFDLFPSARSLIFLPLYDNDRQHIFAGFLGWTTDPTRALQRHEVTYISGFVNSVMCEVMRLEALAMNVSKSDFISSISHELRSPLHGILASSQLLQENEKDPRQKEFISMIDTCGRTLLDIMDHLLDHAKINHFSDRQAQRKQLKQSKRVNVRPETYSLVSQINIASIVEETVASVAASSNQLLRQVGGAVSGVTPLSDTSRSTGKKETLSVPIILNIARHHNWNFASEAGSWRRIVMNLIGNSLKYTKHGHIVLNLEQVEQPVSAKVRMIKLKVTDTGQGISEEFLRHRLFTPFAQEDNLSVGTGLGLNLVHQIVLSLGGKIEVQSEVGSGTEIIVRVPLQAAQELSPTPQLEREDLSAQSRQSTVAFHGFSLQPPAELPTGILHPHIQALLALKESLTVLVREWLGLDVVDQYADVNIIEESFLKSRLEHFDKPGTNLTIISIKGRGLTTSAIKNANYIHLRPPIGPQRMAAALRELLKVKLDVSESDLHRSQSLVASPDADYLLDARTPPLILNGTSTSGNIVCEPGLLTPLEERTSLLDTVSMTPTINSSARDTARVSCDKMDPACRDLLLLVDDNDINLRILVTFVTRLKQFDYITASDGKEALEQYKMAIETGRTISTVFMDISMPVMDGLKSTRKIRAYEKHRGIVGDRCARIVALTGLASEETQNEIDGCGFDLYLRKPVNLKTLKDILLKVSCAKRAD